MRGLLLVLLPLAACRGEFRSVGECSSTVPAEALTSLDVRTGNGELRIITREGTTVEVTVRVEVRRDSAITSADARRDMRVETLSGALSIRDAHLGSEDASDWHVSFSIAAPPHLVAKLASGIGDIEVAGQWNAVDARTGAGNFRGRGSHGDLRVTVGTGSIHLDAERLQGGTLHAGVGAIEVEISGWGPGGDFTVETGTGHISVQVPAGYLGRLNASAAVGRVDLGAEVKLPDKGTGQSVTWQIDPKHDSPGFWARTGVGNIRFRRGS